MDMMTLTVVFDAFLPAVRWGPLFHILRLEQPGLRLGWQPVGFPAPNRPLLDRADVGVFVQPPRRRGLSALTIDLSPMVVVAAVGHPLAQQTEVKVGDVLNEQFPGAPKVDPEWRAFWTLDRHRGGPPNQSDDAVKDAQDGLEAVASGRAIATLPAWATDGLPHPGVVALLLDGGPQVATRLVWRSDDQNPMVSALISLADHLTRGRHGNGGSLLKGRRPE